ncbi:MAG TPA: T9SS type A sorting domain-containing protein [Candidatus Kapabacteria bacterium]|nr:T9SS type A sorting domain-containing protein [Candidatus Kapabacteria bacterium]
MSKKLNLRIIGLIFLFVIESNAQYKSYNIPNYLKPEFCDSYLNNPRMTNIFTRKIKWTYVPPEVAKYMPKQTRIQTAEGFELIDISPGYDAQSETWIAINPTNPQNIIATANDNYYLGGRDNWRMSAWASFDGGQTWTHKTTPSNQGVYIDPPSKGWMTIFDPGVAFNADGNALYTYGYCQVNTPNPRSEISGVFGSLTTDGGASWDGFGSDVPVTAVAVSAYETGNPFHDRFSVAADNNPNSPYKNRFYISWQRFYVNDGVVFAYTTDNGNTWVGPTLLGTGSTQAPLPAVGPDGEVYVAWINSNYPSDAQAIVRKSTNGGQSWGSSVIAQSVVSIGTKHSKSGRFVLTDKQSIRVSSPPQIAVDRSNKSTRGWVYIVQAGRDVDGGPYRIYVARSTDQGKTWQSKIRVDDNQVGNDMFFPSICVDPVTGLVAVLYYSSQNDPTNNQGVDAYLSISTDGGNNWKVLRITPTTAYINSLNDVSDQSNDGSGISGGNLYWGDYTSVAAYNGVIYPLFWMPTMSTGDYGSLDLFTAPISQKIKPVTNLTGKSIFENNQIKIQLDWVNPTTDLFNETIGNFDVLIYRNDNPNTAIATIANTLPSTYTDYNVVDGTWYTYTFIVRAFDGRESLPASVSVLAGGILKPLPPTDITWRPKDDGVQLYWTNPLTAIDGSTIRELSGAKIFLNGALVKTITLTQTQAGQQTTEFIPMDPKTFGKVELQSIATRNDLTAESDTSEEILVYAGPIYTALDETFDDIENSIPRYTENGWVLTTIVSSSAPNSIATTPDANYTNNMTYTMYLAPVILGDTSNTFSFDNMSLIHKTDYGELAMSTDWGKTYKSLNWYTLASSENFKSKDPQGSQWKNEVKDMRPYRGDTVLYRFSLVSGTGLTDRGWFVDNIRLDTRFDVYENNKLDPSVINITPNPVQNVAHIKLTINQPGIVSYHIYDILGKSILNNNIGYRDNPFYDFDIETTALPSGLYLLQVQIGSASVTRPIIITK